MKNFVDLDYKKILFVRQKVFWLDMQGVIPACFVLVKKFVNFHCNQVNAIKRISFASFDITKGKD